MTCKAHAHMHMFVHMHMPTQILRCDLIKKSENPSSPPEIIADIEILRHPQKDYGLMTASPCAVGEYLLRTKQCTQRIVVSPASERTKNLPTDQSVHASPPDTDQNKPPHQAAAESLSPPAKGDPQAHDDEHPAAHRAGASTVPAGDAPSAEVTLDDESSGTEARVPSCSAHTPISIRKWLNGQGWGEFEPLSEDTLLWDDEAFQLQLPTAEG